MSANVDSHRAPDIPVEMSATGTESRCCETSVCAHLYLLWNSCSLRTVQGVQIPIDFGDLSQKVSSSDALNPDSMLVFLRSR